MKRIALIKNGIVQSIAVWDGTSLWNPGENFILIDVTDIFCGPGFLYNGENFFIPQPEEVEDPCDCE